MAVLDVDMYCIVLKRNTSEQNPRKYVFINLVENLDSGFTNLDVDDDDRFAMSNAKISQR